MTPAGASLRADRLIYAVGVAPDGRARAVACALLSAALIACGESSELDAGDASDAGADAALACGEGDCDDGVFCNGVERCEDQRCVSGDPPCGERCDEAQDECVPETCDVWDADGDGLASIACGGIDCDDTDADRHPGNPERCEPSARGHDEDCDPCTVGSTGADADFDGDGFASAACWNSFERTAPDCAGLAIGTAEVRGTDCDDMSFDVHPDQPESCNDIDDDCDGPIDEEVKRSFYADDDRDRFGASGSTPELACRAPSGMVENALDCDDGDASRNPAVREICDGFDTDCDGPIDEDAALFAVYRDADGDGHGDAARPVPGSSCAAPAGYSALADDCDDRVAAVYPGAPDRCDRLHNDCALPNVGTPDLTEDADGDGHSPVDAACSGGFPKDDCDDACTTCPGGIDVCNGQDDDCDGTIDPLPFAANVCAPGSQCLSPACVDSGGLGVGHGHTCVLTASGEVACWGSDGSGQLGDGEPGGLRETPALVSGLRGVAQVVGGVAHTCARLMDGTVRCWGAGSFGQLGDGGLESRAGPGSPVLDLHDAVELASGGRHVCARRASGTVVCWGGGSAGQLGDGSAADRPRPGPVSALDDAVEISAEGGTTCARLSSSRVVCWGLNDRGQLGDGTTASSATPVEVVSIDDAIDIEVGNRHACAMRASGSISCWGSNAFGELGDGTTIHSSVPVNVVGVANVVELAAGEHHTCARLSSGAVMCWGKNTMLGAGIDVLGRGPVAVLGLTDAVAIDASQVHTCARRAGGGVACWGENSTRACGATMDPVYEPFDVPSLP
jgi:alpha-tubulin suppressor-like RCC1 family protein